MSPGTCWQSSCPPGPQGSSTAELLSSWLVLSMYCRVALLLPRCSTLLFLLLNFMRLLSACFSKGHSERQHNPLVYPTLLPVLYQLHREHSPPLSTSLRKMLSSSGLSIPEGRSYQVKTEAKKALSILPFPTSFTRSPAPFGSRSTFASSI